MQTLLKMCSIISIIIVTIKLELIGNLSQGAVIFTMLCGILILVGNRTVFIITSALCALVLFIKLYGGNTAGQFTLLQSILTLALVCFGLYIIFRGTLGKAHHNQRNKSNF
ncbi:MAG TPA: hypothetical protein VHZ50_18775 [Puia sp.]|nr:hypothetical protein [Puia sp.]